MIGIRQILWNSLLSGNIFVIQAQTLRVATSTCPLCQHTACTEGPAHFSVTAHGSAEIRNWWHCFFWSLFTFFFLFIWTKLKLDFRVRTVSVSVEKLHQSFTLSSVSLTSLFATFLCTILLAIKRNDPHTWDKRLSEKNMLHFNWNSPQEKGKTIEHTSKIEHQVPPFFSFSAMVITLKLNLTWAPVTNS